jgi:large subunit ribosomal protein L29
MKRASELRTMTVDELRLEETSMRKELFNLRFQQVTGEIENPLRMRHVRKDIARVLTVINEKLKAGSGEATA